MRVPLRRLLVSLWAAAGVACGGASSPTPTSPTSGASPVLAAGPYLLHIVAPFAQHGCSGTPAAPVLDLTLEVRLTRAEGSAVVITTPDAQEPLTLRLVEGAPASPAMIVPVDGTATGAARAAQSAGGAAHAVRMDGTAVRGYAGVSGASGDVSGGIRFTSDGGDVTCASARWSMGRLQS